MIDPHLQGNVALVTGAATAKAFAEQGASVFINYLRRPLEPEFSVAAMPNPARLSIVGNKPGQPKKSFVR